MSVSSNVDVIFRTSIFEPYGKTAVTAEWKEAIINTESEERISGILALLGLLSGALAAINQLIRLRQWRSEEEQKETELDLAENLDSIETQLEVITEKLKRLETEKDCQD